MSKTFKLVFLPGMDGTGYLFKDVIDHMSGSDYQIVSFPVDTNQDYQTLISYVKNKLPDEDYVLIAESFSGPIAAELAKDKEMSGLKAVIFVATFLSSPNRFLLAASKFFPVKVMNKPSQTPGQALTRETSLSD
jgi:alpha-beta hydrolase superfamily lysophospholipase